MTSKSIEWKPYNTKADIEKHWAVIWMLTEGVLSDYDDSVISMKGRFQYDYTLEYMLKAVDVNGIYDCAINYFRY